MARKDSRYFEDVIEAIKDAEIDIDKFLEAARLDRRERESRRLTNEQKMNIIYGVLFLLAALIGVGFLLCLAALSRH